MTAGLSQEELAERAGLSRRGISDLERGTRRTPYLDTVRRLADALDLDDVARAELRAAVRRATSSNANTDGHTDVHQSSDTGPARAHLPIPLTSFVGREHEIQVVLHLLAGTRLLTLVGAGGVGKTRLALEVARELSAEYPDGVHVVELAPLADSALVTQSVASVLGVRDQIGRPLVEGVVLALRDKRVLLVLDNCEHLIPACAELVYALLRACPRLCILATSREPLGLSGETRWRVPSLSLPAQEKLSARDQLDASEAVRLFVERAQAVLPSFPQADHEIEVVGVVCRKLDGIPLAIELAASLVSGLSVDQIADHLDDRFGLLTSGSREALPRHQTLRAMVDWSYDLLDEPQRQLLQRLSVFAGGWNLEAAQSVCGGDGAKGLTNDVLHRLLRLVDQSLVVADLPVSGGARYRLLETLRQYGRERLLATTAYEGIQQQHALYYTALAEQADPHLRGAQQQLWHAVLEAELDNLRAALQWWIDRGQAEAGLNLAGALGWFWYQHSYLSEGRSWCERLLALPPPAPPARSYAVARVRALFAGGVQALQQGDFVQARAWHEEGLRLSTQANDEWGIAWSLQGLGHTYARTSQVNTAREYLQDSRARWRKLGYRWGEAFSLNWLGNAAYHEGEMDAAHALYLQALAIRREVGDAFSTANTLEYLGRICYVRREYAAAREIFAESLALHRGIGDRQGGQGAAKAHLGLARLACAEGDHAAAATLLLEALRLFHTVSDRPGTIDGLEATAILAMHRRHLEPAARLLAAANRLRVETDQPLAVPERAELTAALGAIQAELADSAFRAAWGTGRALPIDAAIDCAEAELLAAIDT
jgi:predicted ATPase/DNA-binding XRE family transcriptional regulator